MVLELKRTGNEVEEVLSGGDDEYQPTNIGLFDNTDELKKYCEEAYEEYYLVKKADRFSEKTEIWAFKPLNTEEHIIVTRDEYDNIRP